MKFKCPTQLSKVQSNSPTHIIKTCEIQDIFFWYSLFTSLMLDYITNLDVWMLILQVHHIPQHQRSTPSLQESNIVNQHQLCFPHGTTVSSVGVDTEFPQNFMIKSCLIQSQIMKKLHLKLISFPTLWRMHLIYLPTSNY